MEALPSYLRRTAGQDCVLLCCVFWTVGDSPALLNPLALGNMENLEICGTLWKLPSRLRSDAEKLIAGIEG